jgi:serine/threonine-protein kinase
VAGSGPHLTKETQALLRLRLRAAALILLVGFGVFLIRHIVGVLTGEPLSIVLLSFHVFVVLVLGFSTVPLCGRCAVSIKKLRIAELVIFGLPAVFFLMLQHRMTLEDAGKGVTPAPLPFWLLLIFTYGMFIPNTWRRAALVIGPMALAPVLLLVAMMAAYPQVAAVMTLVGVLQHVLVMLVAAAASVFGTHLINTLRREVFEAKQIGQYRLIKPLGAGGMGEVFLAEHRMLKRPCAIKLIHPAQAGDPQVLARFEREVRMTARACPTGTRSRSTTTAAPTTAPSFMSWSTCPVSAWRSCSSATGRCPPSASFICCGKSVRACARRMRSG